MRESIAEDGGEKGEASVDPILALEETETPDHKRVRGNAFSHGPQRRSSGSVVKMSDGDRYRLHTSHIPRRYGGTGARPA